MSPCNKTIYPSKKAASRAIEGAVGRGRKMRLYSYYCQDCRGWHLTQMDPVKWKKAAERRQSRIKNESLD